MTIDHDHDPPFMRFTEGEFAEILEAFFRNGGTYGSDRALRLSVTGIGVIPNSTRGNHHAGRIPGHPEPIRHPKLDEIAEYVDHFRRGTGGRFILYPEAVRIFREDGRLVIGLQLGESPTKPPWYRQVALHDRRTDRISIVLPPTHFGHRHPETSARPTLDELCELLVAIRARLHAPEPDAGVGRLGLHRLLTFTDATTDVDHFDPHVARLIEDLEELPGTAEQIRDARKVFDPRGRPTRMGPWNIQRAGWLTLDDAAQSAAHGDFHRRASLIPMLIPPEVYEEVDLRRREEEVSGELEDTVIE